MQKLARKTCALLLAESIKFALYFFVILSTIKFDEEAILPLFLERHRDQNLEIFLKSNLSYNLFVEISLAHVFENLINFLYSV